MFIQCDHGIVKVFPNWTRGKTRNSVEVTLERDFKPGEIVSLTMTGDCSATAAGVPAVSTCRWAHLCFSSMRFEIGNNQNNW